MTINTDHIDEEIKIDHTPMFMGIRVFRHLTPSYFWKLLRHCCLMRTSMQKTLKTS